MLKQRAGSSKAAKAHPLSPRPLPLSAFAGRWPLRAALDPSRITVFGDAVREAAASSRTAAVVHRVLPWAKRKIDSHGDLQLTRHCRATAQEVTECGVDASGGFEPSFLVLQGNVLFVFEACLSSCRNFAL